MTKDEIKQLAKDGIIVVTFTKKDGSDRVMKCTLQSQYLPIVEDTGQPKKERKENESVLAVFDLDKSEWRSFRIDSVKTVQNWYTE